MPIQPVKQINAILQQEYFEPTITWALRVVLALNVPLIVLPLWLGYSAEVTWAAFGAYMLTLIDYRGQHSNKIMVQSLEAALIFVCGIIGMNVANSLILSVTCMFAIGLCAALIRNWSNYGSSIGVGMGFFFLFGLSNPQPFNTSLEFGVYALLGGGWAVLITLLSFPLRPANPLKRSVAKIWKADTDLLDEMIAQLMSTEAPDPKAVIEKEIAVRNAFNQSRELFERRTNARSKAQHYDMLIELRHTASLFGATLTSLQEESEVLSSRGFAEIRTSTAYKTLSAIAQASARISIVIFTLRAEDLTMAKVRVKRCSIALDLFREACRALTLDEKERVALQHYSDTLGKACGYLHLAITQIEAKLQFSKSEYLENYRLSFNNFVAGLRPDSVSSFVRNALSISSHEFKYALRVALMLSIGVFIFKYFHINHGHWIALTIMIVIQPYYGATLKKGMERIIGTVSGIVLGGAVMLLPLPHEAFVVLLILISFCVAYFLRNNYKVGVFFVTVMMVVMMQLSQQATWQLIGWRVLSTLIGALLAVIAGYALWPIWEKQRFPALMAAALKENKLYLQQVIRYLNKELPKEESWHRNRRLAEAANNDVFACVQRMYDEPEHIRQGVDVYYALAGTSIRVSREITSIALMAADARDHAYATELNNYYHLASKTFDHVAQHVADGSVLQVTDFNKLKATLSLMPGADTDPMHFIKNELEKIIFELETMTLLMDPKPKAA